MTSSTTGDRRWGPTRRSGMTILGKVSVPKPINLPSQRLENQGLDPNVEIVPKGTLSWGSKPSPNAWGTSSLSPRTESGPASPGHLSNRPSSGGSFTRPSTADSDKAHESSSSAWDPNSRPSSASGVFPSNQASVALQRPHSADTRPGSSQLSRFAEVSSENSTQWGQHGPADNLGVVTTKKDGFSLTSGDFPSLGTEKETFEKGTRPEDDGRNTRPAFSSGGNVEERGVDCTEEANIRMGDANVWRRDNQPYSEDAPRHFRDEGQLDSHGSQSYPNSNFPNQYESWRGPPVNNHPGGGWYRGNHPPYGAPMGPGGFHMDPFPFYPPQGQPVPGHGPGPRGVHATNDKLFRPPPMLDSYGHQRMQTRPGFYPGPGPYEGFYGPRPYEGFYGGPGNRDLPFAGRPTGPHSYTMHPGQGGYDAPVSSVALEQNEPSHPQETQRQYKVLLKPQDRRLGEDEAKREQFLANRLPNAEEVAQQMQASKNNKREGSNEGSSVVQPAKAEHPFPKDPSLIQKIEGLNAKTRTNDGWQNASDTKNALHNRQGDPATYENGEPGAISGTLKSRRTTQQTQGRADLQTIRKPGPGILPDPNDSQRSTMRELARQRAQQRQKEEEERAREQKAKALAKLEELNKRSQLSEGSVKNSEGASYASISVMPEDHRSLSPARMSSNSDTAAATAKSVEPLGELGKALIQDAMASTGNANNVGSSIHQDNLPHDRDGNASKQKRLAYKPKQNIASEKTMAGNSVSVATKVVDVVPSPEVINGSVQSHNDTDMPAKSTVPTESTFTKKKNSRNGKKKHRGAEETRVGVGKETKSGDESVEMGKARAAETKLGSTSVPSLDINASGDSSEQISSLTNVTNEESQNRAKSNWKPQHLHRTQRNSVVNKPGEKFPGSSNVIWAPVRPQQKPDVSTGVQSSPITVEFGTISKVLQQVGQTSSKSKRVEIERYVAKSTVAEETISKNLTTAASGMTENVLRQGISGGEGTGILKPPGSVVVGKSPSKSRHGNNGRQGKQGNEHGPWNQRGGSASAASTKALEDGQVVTSKTVNHHSGGSQTEKVNAGSAATRNDNKWNDGWHMTPEPHHSATEKIEANAAVGKDQGKSMMHTKQDVSGSNTDGGSSYGDPRRANKRAYNKPHMQQQHYDQSDRPVAPPKESRGPEDHVSGTNRTGKYGGRQGGTTRDKGYGLKHPTEHMESADTRAQLQNQSTNKEVKVELNQNVNTTSQIRRIGRGQQQSQGDWGSSVQDHHHQRPSSNRDRQKQNVHYEYKPVGSRANDRENNREQLKEASTTEGPIYREKGQGYQRHGGEKLHQQQRGTSTTSGRNTGHGY